MAKIHNYHKHGVVVVDKTHRKHSHGTVKQSGDFCLTECSRRRSRFLRIFSFCSFRIILIDGRRL